MAKLIYATLASLDGFIADEEGRFDWAAPDDCAHAYRAQLRAGDSPRDESAKRA